MLPSRAGIGSDRSGAEVDNRLWMTPQQRLLEDIGEAIRGCASAVVIGVLFLSFWELIAGVVWQCFFEIPWPP